MELLKLLVESYVQLIGHIAWPVAIVVILFIFRKPIVKKLLDLTKAGKGDAYVEFEKLELQEKVDKKKLKFTEIPKESFTWDNYLDSLEQWALWINHYMTEWLLNCLKLKGAKSKAQYEKFEYAMKQYDKVVNKIQKERPKSESLEPFKKFRGLAQDAFERCKSFRTKLHWNDDL